jgi:uncharacterized protein YndB with AHSA1/START domain
MADFDIVVPPGKQEIIITRNFDAPRTLVFKAFTDPNLVPKWWGPNTTSTTVDKMDARPGGSWRYINRNTDGEDNCFHGVYHDVLAPERLIYTFEWEGLPGHVLLETLIFEEHDGRTKVIDTSVFPNAGGSRRDGRLGHGGRSGREHGAHGGAAQNDVVTSRTRAQQIIICC